jgi:hypothetical protein
MQVGSGWERGCRVQRESDPGSRRKGVQRFQHRKHQRVPVFSATVKDQGISLLVYSTQKVVECCTNAPFCGGKYLQKKRPHHIPPTPLPHQKPIFIPTSGPLCCWPKNVKSDDMKRKK